MVAICEKSYFALQISQINWYESKPQSFSFPWQVFGASDYPPLILRAPLSKVPISSLHILLERHRSSKIAGYHPLAICNIPKQMPLCICKIVSTIIILRFWKKDNFHKYVNNVFLVGPKWLSFYTISKQQLRQMSCKN